VTQFDYSLALFRRNYNELRLLLAHIVSPEIAVDLATVTNRWLLHEAMLEVQFLLHNFVAAAQSLIDHSRVLYKHIYEPSGALPKYQEEVNRRFKSDPLTQFVRGLRQMAEHYRLPTIGADFSMENLPAGGATFETKLQLRVADLRQFSEWKAPAKMYLDAAGASIDVAVATRAYYDHVIDFYNWFRQQQKLVHGLTPELWAHLTKHGMESPGPAIVREVLANVGKLEVPERPITFRDLEEALSPALTILDSRNLKLCLHDPHHWIDVALAAICARFDFPDDLPARLHALVRPSRGEPSAPAATPPAHGTDADS
jgi:hypothetical protein